MYSVSVTVVSPLSRGDASSIHCYALAMRLSSIHVLSIVVVIIFLGVSATPQSSVEPKTELVWSLPENEIASPQFSPDGNFIVLVTRVHWPDGEEAESLPRSFFVKLAQRKQRDPRFADPIVRVIDLKGNAVCEIRYGTNPTIAPDNKTIAFSRQRNPITGLRPIASTQQGNDIQLFDCQTKQERTVAEPSTGYFDKPIFLPDGQSIAYTVNEAVNGALGRPVAVERVDANGMQRQVLMTKQEIPGVACPSELKNLTSVQRMMCSDTHLTLAKSFPTLLLTVAMENDQLLALEARPIPNAGDMYLASHYQLSLAKLFPTTTDVLSVGLGDTYGMRDASFQPIAGGEVMIFSKFWKHFSLETREWPPETAPENTNKWSVYSPNGRYYLAVEPRPQEPSHFSLYRTSDGQQLFTSPTMANVFDMAWSRDSNRFSVVIVPKEVSGSAYREVLTVYSLQ